MYKIATVQAVHDDGVALLFDGETAAGAKHYKTSVTVSIGDRVIAVYVNGSYMVICKL
jgi:hypothetical protein